MRVLIFHGYMLRGTGSNIYNANLARALACLGHEVHLLCQEREVELEGVQIHNPDIGGLLPVYVKDPYEGFEVKAFPELTDAELGRYLAANVEAVRAVAAEAGGIEAAIANHLIMGPAVLARADIAPFAAKIHGSALEYTVKPNPRFLPYAREGIEAASGVLVGSGHTAESLWSTLGDVRGLEAKTRLGPPGVDLEEFQPRCADQYPRRIVFVGKLIASKGVDLLLAAWPLLRAAHPDLLLQIAGFGEFEEGLRALWGALEAGDLSGALEIARSGRALEGGKEEPLKILTQFLAHPPAGYAQAGRDAGGSVEFIGRLEHEQVAGLLPGAAALVMPSTFPEAFGMVLAEAAACGVLPISAGHSGMWEVSRELAAALAPPVAELLSFPVRAGAIEAIADRLDRWLALPESEREPVREALVATASRLWSWEGVARGTLAAAAGRLDELAAPG
ncbi:MAG: glycosyltransferase family 4 protein [Solirubrobacterales bacterium]